MPCKTKTLCLIAASILLASCSNKFNSKEEASNARFEFLKGGREIIIVDVPTDEELKKQITWETEVLESTCDVVKGYLRTGQFNGIPMDADDIRSREKFVKQHCYPDSPTILSNKESLTTRRTVKTRTCNYEEETKSFVCKEWQVRGDEIMKEDWHKIKGTYTYFRF